jgi:DNA-binding CsgD family transcriptional regulator
LYTALKFSLRIHTMARRTWEQYENYILQQWPLTRREVQITLECIKGKKNKEIATVLGIGAETVNKTLDHIYRATGVNGRDQLVAKLLVADLDNTPLQQSLTLAGEGAALVGAGFLASLYSSRGERKRPRSTSSAQRAAKSAADRATPPEQIAATGILDRSEESGAAPARSHSAKRLERVEIPSNISEDMAWMMGSESLMDTIATEQ